MVYETTIHYTFYTGPTIVVPGADEENSISFPSYNMSGSFFLQVYSTSSISSLTFQRSSSTAKMAASNKKQFFAELQYSSPYDILNVYKVGIPWLTDKLSGEYQVKVTNDERESSNLDIMIIKADGK